MKKKSKKLLLTLLAILSCLFIGTTVHAAGKEVKLTPGRTYNYDITGDGKKDKLKLRLITLSDYQQHLTVYVNGKLAHRIKSTTDRDIYSYNASLLVLDNKKSFLFIHGEGVSGPVYSSLFQYRQGKLKEIINFITLYGKSSGWGCAQGFDLSKKNKITVEYANVSYVMGAMNSERTYVYKNGTLKRSPLTDKFTSKRKTYTTLRSINFYEKVGNQGKSFTVRKGQKVTVDKVRRYNGYCYFHGKVNGKHGWFTKKITNRPMENPLFKEIFFVR